MAKCPVCGKTKPHKQDIIDHIEKEHSDSIPENMSTAQYIYSLNHGRDYGLCRVCGNKTDWNEKTGKPRQLCNNPACREKRRKIAQRNMIRVYGKDTLLNDPVHQEKMLANRKISGVYKWSDNKHEFIYTGSYEKFALEWLDTVMDYDPDGIVMPGPIVYYEYNGAKKPWITDMYLPDLNLVIEFKDGSFDRNTHEGFSENRKKEAAKDNYMKKQSQYNYTKITNKNMMSLIKVINMIRLDNIFSEERQKPSEPVVVIHESTAYDNPLLKMKNSEIDELCESISMSHCNSEDTDSQSEAAVMSVANISPIQTTGQFEELKESPLGQSSDISNSTMMFGDGVNSAICDSNSPYNFTVNESPLVSRLAKIAVKHKAIETGKNIVDNMKDDEMTETPESESDQMFSNHEFGTWNPLDSSDNFREMNENGKSPKREDEETIADIKSDIETDPTSYGENPVSSIASSIYSSNFLTEE